MNLDWLPQGGRKRLFLHDALFRMIFTGKGVLEEIIWAVTDKRLTLESWGVQSAVDNPGGHSIILDSVGTDANKGVWNVEVQNYNGDDVPKRMRFYLDLLSARSLPKGADYSELPNVCVIFITSYDVHGLGLPLYETEPRFRSHNPEEKALFVEHAEEIAQKLDDGRYGIIVNAAVSDGGNLSKLIEALTSPEPVHEDLFPCITQAKRMILESDEGREKMIKFVDKYDQDNWENGKQIGVDEGRKLGVDELTRKLSALTRRLVADGRASELTRVCTDPAYRDALCTQYFPEGSY